MEGMVETAMAEGGRSRKRRAVWVGILRTFINVYHNFEGYLKTWADDGR